jgi:uncharacterized protein YqgV (UPF0045/DUF77 family)
MIVEIQCLPSPAGTRDHPYAHIDAAIAVIEQSGVPYEVEPLGTSVEGDPDRLWPLLRRVHEAALEAGADSLVTVVKLEQTADPSRQPTMDRLTRRHRSG